MRKNTLTNEVDTLEKIWIWPNGIQLFLTGMERNSKCYHIIIFGKILDVHFFRVYDRWRMETNRLKFKSDQRANEIEPVSYFFSYEIGKNHHQGVAYTFNDHIRAKLTKRKFSCQFQWQVQQETKRLVETQKKHTRIQCKMGKSRKVRRHLSADAFPLWS